MKAFPVADDVVALVWHRANPRPFENLSFSDALRRVLNSSQPKRQGNGHARRPTVDELLAELDSLPKQEVAHRIKYKIRLRAPSPNPDDWVSSVPELSKLPNLNSWQAICDHLKVEVAGDSARRKLRDWARINRPNWPEVPTVSGA